MNYQKSLVEYNLRYATKRGMDLFIASHRESTPDLGLYLLELSSIAPDKAWEAIPTLGQLYFESKESCQLFRLIIKNPPTKKENILALCKVVRNLHLGKLVVKPEDIPASLYLPIYIYGIRQWATPSDALKRCIKAELTLHPEKYLDEIWAPDVLKSGWTGFLEQFPQRVLSDLLDNHHKLNLSESTRRELIPRLISYAGRKSIKAKFFHEEV